MTKEQKEKIIRFRRQGLGYADIGRELDISKDTVKSFCRRNGLMVSDSKPADDTARFNQIIGLIQSAIHKENDLF